MFTEYYWLKKFFVFTIACFTLFIKSNVNPNSVLLKAVYFNNYNYHCGIASEKAFIILPLLTEEDLELKLFLPFNNNFSICRYTKVRSVEPLIKNNLANNYNSILLTCNKHTVKYTFVLFPMRC